MSGVDISGLVEELRAAAHNVYTPDNVVLKLERAADALLAQAAELAEARAERDRAIGRRKVWHDFCCRVLRQHRATTYEATRQRDEALAALKASEERETAAIEAGRDLLSYLALYDFKDRDPGEELPEHMARLTAALFARSALENGPAGLADATNNPPSDPGTEQREAGV